MRSHHRSCEHTKEFDQISFIISFLRSNVDEDWSAFFQKWRSSLAEISKVDGRCNFQRRKRQ